MHRFTALTLLVSSVALAQTTGALRLSYPGSTQETLTFSPNDCSFSAQVSWSFTGLTPSCGPLKMWVTTGTCTAPGAGDYDLGTTTLQTTPPQNGTKTVEFSRLPGFGDPADGGFACGGSGKRAWRVCASYKGNGAGAITLCGTTQDIQADLGLEYDGIPPGVPTITEALGADEAIRVRATVDADTTAVRFAVRPQGDGTDFAFGNEVATSTTDVERRIDGLVNGQSYEIAAVALDAAGNQSAVSSTVFATPIRTAGFFERYKEAGGTEAGGCSAAPGLLGALAFIGAALLISRRKRS